MADPMRIRAQVAGDPAKASPEALQSAVPILGEALLADPNLLERILATPQITQRLWSAEKRGWEASTLWRAPR